MKNSIGMKKSQNLKADICDYESTRESYVGVDYVFHLAAESRLQPDPLKIQSMQSLKMQ